MKLGVIGNLVNDREILKQLGANALTGIGLCGLVESTDLYSFADPNFDTFPSQIVGLTSYSNLEIIYDAFLAAFSEPIRVYGLNPDVVSNSGYVENVMSPGLGRIEILAQDTVHNGATMKGFMNSPLGGILPRVGPEQASKLNLAHALALSKVHTDFTDRIDQVLRLVDSIYLTTSEFHSYTAGMDFFHHSDISNEELQKAVEYDLERPRFFT